MKRIWSGIFAVMLLLSLAACGTGMKNGAEKTVLAMDTYIRLTAHGGKAAKAVREGEACVLELEQLLSRTLEDSDVSRVNASAGELTEVDPVTAKLMQAAVSYTEETTGAFDVTVAPVVEAWGFTTDTRQVPTADTLESLLAAVDGEALRTEQDETGVFRAACGADQQIDLGGIAKGYASDRVADIFTKNEVSGGLAALGGNVLAYGAKENGDPWKVGVQDPAHPEDVSALVGIVELKNAFAVTSGGYQRYFEENGKTYHHIIDPATGYPADSGLTSVTVVADCFRERSWTEPWNGTMCDALSTALFVMGEEEALAFRKSSGYDFDLVLVTADGRVVVTSGIAEEFSFNEESGYLYEIVS